MRSWIVGGLVSASVLAGSGPAASASDGVLFVAPARHSVLQVLQDVLRRHSGHGLVSYQAGSSSEQPRIHAWTGTDWVAVSMSDYRQGRFFRGAPTRALMLGGEELLPDVLVAQTEWVPVVLVVPELDTASVLNAVGRLLDFRPAEWRWFARRYDLDVTDANEPLREQTWYDQPHEPRRFERPPPPVPPRRRSRVTPEPREDVRPTPPPPPPPPAPEVPVLPEPEVEVMEFPAEDPPEEPALPRPAPAKPEPAVSSPPSEPGIK